MSFRYSNLQSLLATTNWGNTKNRLEQELGGTSGWRVKMPAPIVTFFPYVEISNGAVVGGHLGAMLLTRGNPTATSSETINATTQQNMYKVEVGSGAAHSMLNVDLGPIEEKEQALDLLTRIFTLVGLKCSGCTLTVVTNRHDLGQSLLLIGASWGFAAAAALMGLAPIAYSGTGISGNDDGLMSAEHLFTKLRFTSSEAIALPLAANFERITPDIYHCAKLFGGTPYEGEPGLLCAKLSDAFILTSMLASQMVRRIGDSTKKSSEEQEADVKAKSRKFEAFVQAHPSYSTVEGLGKIYGEIRTLADKRDPVSRAKINNMLDQNTKEKVAVWYHKHEVGGLQAAFDLLTALKKPRAEPQQAAKRKVHAPAIGIKRAGYPEEFATQAEVQNLMSEQEPEEYQGAGGVRYYNPELSIWRVFEPGLGEDFTQYDNQRHMNLMWIREGTKGLNVSAGAFPTKRMRNEEETQSKFRHLW